MDYFDSRAKNWDENPQRNERARVAAEMIALEVPLTKEMRAFEYGCGTGLLSFALAPNLGPIVLADSSSGMLEVVREKIAAVKSEQMTPLLLDLAVDPPPPAQFNLIYTLMTMHHVDDTQNLLCQFYAIAASAAHLCIIDLDLEDGSFHGEGFQGHRGFDRKVLGGQMQRAGWQNIRFHTVQKVVKAGKEYSLFLAVGERKT